MPTIKNTSANIDVAKYPTSSVVVLLFIILFLQVWTVIGESVFLSAKQLSRLEKLYGQDAGKRLTAWQQLIAEHRQSPDNKKLQIVNDYFNKLRFVSDQELWGQRDYWATPVEFIGKHAGDCEDFTVAKYFTLQAMGVPIEKLRMTYVKATSIDQAHMVLGYYPATGAEPLILDNLEKSIKPASRRQDLIPTYGFNGDNLWKTQVLSDYGTHAGRTERLVFWQNLIERMHAVHKIRKE